MGEIQSYKDNKLQQLKERKKLSRKISHDEEEYLKLIVNVFKYKKFGNKPIKEIYKQLTRNYDFPKEKQKFFEIFIYLREKNYYQAELNSYQLLLLFKEDSSLQWNDEKCGSPQDCVIAKEIQSFIE